jgi:Lipopolysaccharide-assembly
MSSFGLSVALAALLSGCAGYGLGPTNGLEAGERSIQVNPFSNETTEPRLVAPVTTSIRKQLQRDGTYRLATRNEGDIIVSGHILEYDRSSLSYQPKDTLTPRDYRISIMAQVNARERHSGKVILNRRVQGHTTVRVGIDLNSAERQAIPLLADDLARNVTSLLVDGQW